MSTPSLPAVRCGILLTVFIAACCTAMLALQPRAASACTPDGGSASFAVSGSAVNWTVGAPPWTTITGTPSIVFSGSANWGNTGANGGGACIAAATGLQIQTQMTTAPVGSANPSLIISNNEFSVTCSDPGGNGGTFVMRFTAAQCESYPAFSSQTNVSWNTTLTFVYRPDLNTGADTYTGAINIIATHT